ncbi:MAG: nucleoside triphosphate pyrophosphohydrolase [Parvibaculaceae bacterium]|nr:nucleoside triphosphate pyrophosphohydrolase [Parvibaculaceae bacterium]
MSLPSDTRSIHALLAVMAQLRNPDGGCPWDLEQDFNSIAPYTLEEAYEVVDAIERHNLVDLREELGDLLLQVVFHAQMASEQQAFDFSDVVQGIVEKMIRRHPHVFGDEESKTAGAVAGRWDQIKEQEKAEKLKATLNAGEQAPAPESLLDDVPVVLPGLTQAVKLQKKAAKVGFDWPDTSQVIDKLNEEMLELSQEVTHEPRDTSKIEDELGDILFVYANLARHLGVDPEAAIRRTNQKFRRRFGRIEELLSTEGKEFDEMDLAGLDKLWDQAKKEERS